MDFILEQQAQADVRQAKADERQAQADERQAQAEARQAKAEARSERDHARLRRLARAYARKTDTPWERVRCDVVTVVFARRPQLQLVRNAFNI